MGVTRLVTVFEQSNPTQPLNHPLAVIVKIRSQDNDIHPDVLLDTK
jgi:hypothetical protein